MFGKEYDVTETLMDVIKNDFLKQVDRSPQAEIALLETYVPDAEG